MPFVPQTECSLDWQNVPGQVWQNQLNVTLDWSLVSSMAAVTLPALEVHGIIKRPTEIVLPNFEAVGVIQQGMRAEVTLPNFEVASIPATVITLPNFEVVARTGAVCSVVLPNFEVEAQAVPDIPISAAITLPNFEVTANTGAIAEVELPRLIAAGTVSIDSILSAAVTLPNFVVNASVSQIKANTLSAAVTLPGLQASGRLGNILNSGIQLPGLLAAGRATPTMGSSAIVTLPAPEVVASAYMDDSRLDCGVTLPAPFMIARCRQSDGEHILQYTNARSSEAGENPASADGYVIGYER